MDAGVLSLVLLGRPISLALITFSGVKFQSGPPHLPVDNQMRGELFSPKGTEPICKDLSFLFTRKRKDGWGGINSDVMVLRRTVGLEAIWSRCWQGLWERGRRAAALSGGGVLGSGKDSNLSWNFWPTKDAYDIFLASHSSPKGQAS